MRILMIAPPGAARGLGAPDCHALTSPHRDRRIAARSRGAADRARPGRQKYLDRGELVPDQVVLDMVREAMVAAKAAGGGFVLDGIREHAASPRDLSDGPRARDDRGCGVAPAGHDAELTRRLLARAALEHRSDDTPDIIAQRLALYYEVTSPILSWYRVASLVPVDAMRSAHQVGREILAALEAMRPPGSVPGRDGSPLTSPVWGTLRCHRPRPAHSAEPSKVDDRYLIRSSGFIRPVAPRPGRDADRSPARRPRP